MFASNKCKSVVWCCSVHHSIFLDRSGVAEVVPEVTDVINRGGSDNKMLWCLISQWGSVLHSVCIFPALNLSFCPSGVCDMTTFIVNIWRETMVIFITSTWSCPLCPSAFRRVLAASPSLQSPPSEGRDNKRSCSQPLTVFLCLSTKKEGGISPFMSVF